MTLTVVNVALSYQIDFGLEILTDSKEGLISLSRGLLPFDPHPNSLKSSCSAQSNFLSSFRQIHQ
ncbi:hypothetical protein N9964_00385, partial [bacterium]|nr:hypothetical protein [bacterium]